MTTVRIILVLLLLLAPQLWLQRALAQEQDVDEQQMGRATFQELKAQGEIVSASPLYAVLRPITERIVRVAQPQYQYPIHFYIVHEKSPNAFATAGGNIYVVDSMFYFVHNTEELAGTLCHETSHLIHHDAVRKMSNDDRIGWREFIAAVLLGGDLGTALAISMVGDLDSQHYSRDVEEAADIKGSDTCAAAGYNPWGLVWLFRDFSDLPGTQTPEVLSDHPDDEHRIEALEEHFRKNPATFARFDSDVKSATPLRLPKDRSEKFLT